MILGTCCSVWISGRGKELQEAKARFAVAEGDLVTYINVVKAWEMHKRSRQWSAPAVMICCLCICISRACGAGG